MRILYFAYGTGSNIHTERWMRFFADRGHDVHALNDRPASIPGVKVHTFWRPYRWPLISDWLAVHLFRQQVAKIKPDILHGHFITYYGFQCALSGFRPLVLTAWGTDIYSKLKESRKNRIFTKYALRRADLVTGDSKNIMDECITLGASPTICHVIINGVDSAVFYPREDCEDLIEKLKLKDRRIIISNRHFSPPYNIDIIIRAIPLVLERYADAVFILKNAYGYQEPELRKLAEELGVSSAVRFVGAVDYPDMAKYLSISELFLSVPSWDSSSVSMLEAMACGAVPIVSDLPAAREWIREGYNGYLVPTKDHVALAEKITGLLHDRKRRENFRQRNFELVTKADQNANMEKMEKLYLRLLVEKGQ